LQRKRRKEGRKEGRTSPFSSLGIEDMAFPSQVTFNRLLHNSFLRISGERLQVARDIVERTPQGPFDVSSLCSLVEIFTS
jgi:hypothetical protein